MPGFTTAGKDLVKRIIGQQASPPAELWAALRYTRPSAGGDFEVSASGYTRQLVTFLDPEFGIPQDEPGSFIFEFWWTRPAGEIRFDTPLDSWYDAASKLYLSIYDAETSGTELYRFDDNLMQFRDNPAGIGRPYEVVIDPKWVTVRYDLEIQPNPSRPADFFGYVGEREYVTWSPQGLELLIKTFWQGTAFAAPEMALVGINNTDLPNTLPGENDGDVVESNWPGYARVEIPWATHVSGQPLESEEFEFAPFPKTDPPRYDGYWPHAWMYSGSVYLGSSWSLGIDTIYHSGPDDTVARFLDGAVVIT